MKILYDHQIFSTQQYGGVSKYFCELLKYLPTESWETTIQFSNNEYLKSLDNISYFSFLPDKYFKGKASIMELMNRPYTLYQINCGKYDIFHQTDYASYYFNFIKNKKMVTTFHDMNYSKYKELYNANVRESINKREKLQKKSIDKADIIIAISNHTKNDLVNIWHINPSKIKVIHHGVEKKKITKLGTNKLSDFPYILYVGERYGFKNFNRFAKAFSILNKAFPDLHLICTGRKFSEEEKKYLMELNIMNKTKVLLADENMMATLYRDAEMFVYPSISEGFGMPILESMVYECPIVLSNTSCFPEVAGNAGIYFNPFEVDDIVEKMTSVLISSNLRKKLLNLSILQLQHFSWEKSANEHMLVYNSLL